MKRCNGVLLFQREREREGLFLPSGSLFLGCTVVSGERVCGNDDFKIPLERTDRPRVFLQLLYI